uniref:UNC93-like protein MFSD11 n=1 Tax=Ornithodoros turicata TaxID=34597 RepID=A0A2R5LAG9_9ACAR
MNVKTYNVAILGFAFMFIFTAFQTGGLIQKVVLDSIQKEDPNYKGDGYVSLAVIYSAFAIANWLAPSFIGFLGPKITMLIGAVTYNIYIAQFLFPVTWGLYVASVAIGVGAAFIWTGQGNFLTINSDSTTMSRNSGIFWAMLQCSLIWGNIFVFIQFQGLSHIDHHTRTVVFGGLTAVGILGMLLLLVLRGGGRPGKDPSPSNSDGATSPAAANDFIQAFVTSLKMFKSRKMLILSFVFFYTGLELSFFSGVYGACLGFTKSFGSDSSKFLGINGLLIGLGEITGGLAFSILGKKTNRAGRDPIVLLGYLVHMVSFYTIFINLPATSPLGDTLDPAYITSNLTLALVGSFLLGLGDSCYNTQIYSLLGNVYADDSAPAFAIFKFMQALAAAAAFYYSNYLLLPYQLLILVVSATVGTFCFWHVEWETYVTSKQHRVSSSIQEPALT